MPAAQYSQTQLNYFKFASIVLDEFPEALRQVFKTMWDTKFSTAYCPWDDSVSVRNQLSLQEGYNPKIPTGKSYKEWDCTALFQATIFASSFKDSAGQTLYNRYLRSSIPPTGSFRPTVISSTGVQDETFALAIDQLRLLRNQLSHSFNTEVIDKTTFHYYIVHAKMAFKALHYSTSYIDYISNLLESEFPTGNVAELKERIKEMRDDKKRIQIALLLFILLFVARDHIRSFFFKPSAVPKWMNTSNPIFIGRHWLFEQLEDFFQENNDSTGVLLVGDPGSGKTAIMKQLVSSRNNSSRFIHENIIAYHFCEFDRETTRDGETLVKSLVEQLSEVEGFKKSIENEEIQNTLAKCKNHPIECAKVTVLEPLYALNISLENKKFILIDALDECREKNGNYNVIIEILHSKKLRPSSGVKLLVSSRNERTITRKMLEIGVKTMVINATSKDNLNDIRSFTKEMISRYGESLKEKLNGPIETILNKTDGNFLFIQKLFEYWATDPNQINLTYIPSDLTYVYARSFRERVGKNEMKRFAKFFEVLLASNSPPTLQFLRRILTLQMDDYDLDGVIDKLRTYIRFDKGIVRIYHQSFADWLTNQNVDGFSIKKSRGHQYIADYLFDYYNLLENELTVERLYQLSLHVLNGEMLPKYVMALTGLNSEIFDQSGECILHYLARNRESTEVLEVFIPLFKSVDISNAVGLTPAYYATIAENYHNLELLIEKRADVNYVASVLGSCGFATSVFRPTIIFEKYHSLIFIAAYKGNTKIVELLINNGAHVDQKDNCGWKPLYAAVGEGHLKVVELLIDKSGTNSGDVLALHQATFLNHSDVLNILLDAGITDKCIPCTLNYTAFSNLSLTSRHFSDIICGSVLNTAVSNGNLNIVKMLLLYGKDTLECKSCAGLTPLMHAVERNNTMMVTLLLKEGADVEAQCETNNVDMNLKREFLRSIVPSTYYCFCTSKAIHISAIMGTSKITNKLMQKADPFSRDCMGWSADDLAAIHHQFINTSLLNNKTVIRYVAVCSFVKTLKLLSTNRSSGALTTVNEDGMTLLHLATLGLTKVFYRVCKMINCTAFKCPHIDALPKYDREKQSLKTIKLLTKVAPQIINKKDKHGRTALHYAALVRSPSVVKHLIQKGSDWTIKDEGGNTALEFVLKRPIDYRNLGPCSTVIYSLLNSSEMVICKEMHVNCLIMLKSLNIECQNPRTIVGYIADHNLPLSWYTLLKIDADLNCVFHKYFSFLGFPLYEPIATISKLLAVFKFDVKVNCEAPFDYSYLHNMAYYLYYDFSPLQRFVEAHPNSSRILDEHYDMEGYLPFHRAVQGGHPNTVNWFINQGVDIWKKTSSGWTSLDVSLTHGNCLPLVIDKLLNSITKNKEYNVSFGSDFWCNTTSAPLSLLHIAAINGIECFTDIHQNTFIPIPRLPFTSCNNTHGIDILYLIKLYHDVEWTTEWEALGLSTNTTLAKYPERHAEYHLIYNNFFATPQVNLKLEVDVLDLFRHPGINDFLPHGHVIEGQIKRCKIRCWRSASYASRNFSSVFIVNDMFDPHSDGFIKIVPQMAELRYQCVKMFYKVSTTLWRLVSKAYACSQKCRYLEIMRLLQKEFTSTPFWFGTVGKFAAERMGWNNTSLDGDILYRWPFDFLLKKALKMDKDYDYLKILSPNIHEYE